jgi:hypothetical protein
MVAILENMMTEWIQSPRGNLMLGNIKERFYVSFTSQRDIFGKAGCETALCIALDESGREMKYLILDGDWRKEYEPLVEKGLDACKKFYQDNKADFASSWSDHE